MPYSLLEPSGPHVDLRVEVPGRVTLSDNEVELCSQLRGERVALRSADDALGLGGLQNLRHGVRHAGQRRAVQPSQHEGLPLEVDVQHCRGLLPWLSIHLKRSRLG